MHLVRPAPKASEKRLNRFLGCSLWMSLSDEASVHFSIKLLAEDGTVGENTLSNRLRSVGYTKYWINHQTMRTTTAT